MTTITSSTSMTAWKQTRHSFMPKASCLVVNWRCSAGLRVRLQYPITRSPKNERFVPGFTPGIRGWDVLGALRDMGDYGGDRQSGFERLLSIGVNFCALKVLKLYLLNLLEGDAKSKVQSV